MLRVGESVGGYDIVAKLRAGGMATLFLGKKHGAAGFSRHVAIKVVHEHLASDPDFVRMFVDEALLQARIQNPHVVHVEELGESEGAHFMVMEYVHGCALAQLLLALSKRKRRPQIDIAVSIALQTLAGLHAAHELRGDDGKPLGVVHRDVSPQNVLLSRDGHVKLIDFGVAKAASSLNQTQGAMLKGKLRYMPPEQANGRPVDRRADLYALGIVLWEMLTMRKLFGATDDLALLDLVRNPVVEPPSKWAADVSPALDRVVLKALHKDPAQRFATAQEMRRALAEACPGATMMEASSIAELIEASVGDELEKERKALPAAVGAQVGPSPDRTRVIEERADEVLLTLTVSALGLDNVKSDMAPISGSMSDYARTSQPNGQAPLLPPGATPPPAPVSSVPVGTPSGQFGAISITDSSSQERPLGDLGPISLRPGQSPSATTYIVPTQPRRSILPFALAAVAVVLLAGGGAYAWRVRSTPGEMVAMPLPLRGTTTGAVAPAPPPSVPTSPIAEPTAADPSAPAAPITVGAVPPGPAAPGAPPAVPAVPAAGTPAVVSPTAGAHTGASPAAVRGAGDTAASPATPRGEGARRGTGRRHPRGEGGERTGSPVPFTSEF